MSDGDDLDRLVDLVDAVRAGAKYRHVTVELVRRIGAQELARRRTMKEAVKATRNKLHQVGAAYLPGPMRYGRWIDELRNAVESGAPAAVQKACLRIMEHHTSTRERLPILERFYVAALADIAPIHSVLDLACGLNPLAIPWMPLAPDVTYYAYDIYDDMMAFLGEAMALLKVRGIAESRDIATLTPPAEVDVAYLLKAIPCMEQMDRNAGLALLESVPARHLMVSFPVHSLGGRQKGMPAHYEAHLRELLADRPWKVQRFEFATELAFLISKDR
jgi:16S rRNA (guanine(1405)-N(7))-methyltransferase